MKFLLGLLFPVFVAEFISPKKVYTLSFIVGNIIPKSVKCIHSATKPSSSHITSGALKLKKQRLGLNMAWCDLMDMSVGTGPIINEADHYVLGVYCNTNMMGAICFC